ncbi:MAG TPA: xanthine dehydrogenase family protein subunit M [Gemmatimonadota bacterium]|nr:xanthine dehydrogenase family protein subunit M [Gemmatimonadota bacterium]
MKPAAFAYHAPRTLDEALGFLADGAPDARLLAGGQSLVPAMNFRLAAPAILIDLNRIPELAYIREANGGLSIGAMTRQREVERSATVARRAPLLHEALPWIAHPQIRNRGTIGGSVAHADPAAELPAVMLALEARFRIRSRSGAGADPEGRTIEAGGFYHGLFATALAPDEILVEIAVPAPPPRTGWAFREIARRSGDYALVGVAARVTLDEDGRCEKARIALFSVGDGPVLAEEAAEALAGRSLDDESLEEAAAILADRDIDPPGDIHASADYRRHLASVLTRQALARAAERATQARAELT